MEIATFSDLNYLADVLSLEYRTTFSNFFIFRFKDCIPPQDNVDAMHFTQFYEIAITRQDYGIIKHNNRVYNDLHNSLHIVAPGSLLSYDEREDKKSEGMSILFHPNLFSPERHSYDIVSEFPFFKLHGSSVYKLKEEQLNELYKLYELLFEEFIRNGSDCYRIIQAYVNVILYKIKQFTANTHKVLPITRAEQIAYRFEELVQARHHQRLSLSEYASCLNISAIYLSECVKKVNKKAPKQIIIDYQILKAKSLLLQSNRTIAEVAQSIGFEEATYFTKFFRKHTGLSPKQFRQQP
ncbi:helix-turn-helix domain-containing protein [Prolixibacteraceae bacterium JC049]|nr:helix-turn-helix domain-containing protein [Prolixibacteraceae bacterium JC049]